MTEAVPTSIREVMSRILTDEAIDRWWTTPHEVWGGVTPAERYKTHPHHVWKRIASYSDPSYS